MFSLVPSYMAYYFFYRSIISFFWLFPVDSVIMDGSHMHKGNKTHPAPESRVGDEGTSKRNITRKGGVKVRNILSIRPENDTATSASGDAPPFGSF